MKIEKNKKTYLSEPGDIIKIIKKEIQKNLSNNGSKPSKTQKHQRIEKIKGGKFKNSDLKYLIRGIEFIQAISNSEVEKLINVLQNEDNITEKRAKLSILIKFANLIARNLLESYKDEKYAKYNLYRRNESLENLYKIIEKSRDGKITKEITRIEYDDKGNEKHIKYEVPMTENEIANIVSNYTNTYYKIQDECFSKYLGLGMSIIDILGEMYDDNKKGQSYNKEITLSTLIKIGTWLARKHAMKDYYKDVKEERNIASYLEHEIIKNEPVTENDKYNQLDMIMQHINKAYKNETDIRKKYHLINAIEVISTSIIVSKIALKEMGKEKKINAATLSKIILRINKLNNLINNMTNNISNIYTFQQEKKNLEELERQLEEIIKQIEEKQDPLIERKQKFNKIKIQNFHGKFYPRKNYETGKVEYRHTLEIPEFSAEAGQVVLISGKSGKGKSTFFKLLKRGDIDNRKPLLINDKEEVDKLGKQFIALKADDKLGIQTNVLQQLTGKETISKLTKEELERLNFVLEDVNLNKENIMERLMNENYNQFSTGEQKRLVLARSLYKSNNEASILLVDEPVENVEEELIEEQLKVITEYCKKRGIITLLSTHRVDIANKYVDKRYHIGEDYVMREVQKEEKSPILENEI